MSRGGIGGLLSPHPLAESLPALMQDDDVTVRWVSGLDEVVAPVYATLDNLDAYLDPGTAPADWLEWLSQWVALPGQLELDETRRRRALRHAGDLFARRGTASGLCDLVSTTLRCTVEVVDNGGASWSAAPGGELPGTATPSVTVRVTGVDEGASVSAAALRSLLADAVPAHLQVVLDLGPIADSDSDAGAAGAAAADQPLPDKPDNQEAP